MSESAGAIVAEVRLDLDKLEKDGASAQNVVKNITNKLGKQGAEGGKVYVAGFGKAQAKLNSSLNGFVSSMQGISPKMGKIGEGMAQAFSKPVFTVIPQISMAMNAALPMIGMIVGAFVGVKSIIDKIVTAQDEHTAKIALTKRAAEGLLGAYKEHTKTLLEQSTLWEDMKYAVHDVNSEYGKSVLAQKELAIEARLYKDVNEEIVKIGEEHARTLDEIRAKQTLYAKGHIGDTKEIEKLQNQFDKERLSAIETAIDALIVQREIAKSIASDSGKAAEIDAELAALNKEREVFAALTAEKESAQKAEKTEQEKIAAARLAAIEKFKIAEKTAQDASDAGLIDQKGLQAQLNTAKENEYKDMEAIVAQYRNATGAAALELAKTKEVRDELGEEVKTTQEALALDENRAKAYEYITSQAREIEKLTIDQMNAAINSAKTDEERKRLTEELINYENALVLATRARGWEEEEQSARYAAATTEMKDTIKKNYDEITQAMLKNRDTQEESTNKIKEFMDSDGAKIGAAALDAVGQIGGMMVEQMQKDAEAAIAIVEAALQAQLAQIEAARQAELEAEGFAEATTQESLQKKLDAATESGDQVLQYNIKRRMQEKAINDKYDAQAKAAEEKAAHEKAAIQYEADKAKYAMDIVNATNSIAMAILNAWATTTPAFLAPVMAGIAGAAGAFQLGILFANPPKPPSFASGGVFSNSVVTKPTNFNMGLMGEAGPEAIMPLQEMADGSLGVASSGGGGTATQIIEIYIDGVLMGKAVANVLNNEPMLRARAILN